MDPGPKFVQHYFQNIQNKFLSYLFEKQFFVWTNNSILLNCRFIMYRELEKWIGSHRIRIFPPDIRKNTCKHRALHWTIWIKGWIASGWFERKGRILLFNIVLCKMASAARNWLHSSLQTEATTSAFSSVFILLLYG